MLFNRPTDSIDREEDDFDLFSKLPAPLRRFFCILIIAALVLLASIYFYASSSRCAATEDLQLLLSSAPAAASSDSQGEVSLEILPRVNTFLCHTPEDATETGLEALSQSSDLLSLAILATDLDCYIEPVKIRLHKQSSSGGIVAYSFSAHLSSVASNPDNIATVTGTLELTKVDGSWKVSALSFTILPIES